MNSPSIAALAALWSGISEFAAIAKRPSDSLKLALPPEIQGDFDRARDAATNASTPETPLGRLRAITRPAVIGARVHLSASSAAASLLSTVVLDPARPPLQAAAFPLAPLSFEREILVARERSGVSIAELFAEFEEALKAVAPDSLAGLNETLLALLETYTWCIAADNTDSVSLFEQTRATAALAAVFAGDNAVNADSQLMLVVGDLGGIQRFLYTVIASKAAKMLRGRSLGLQLIADSIARQILARFHLPATNLLYSGGGKLWLLMPPSSEQAIRALAEDIDLELSKAHGGRLSFTIGCATAKLSEFASTAPKIWARATADLAQSRHRRFSGILLEPDGYKRIFGAGDAIAETCKVCGASSSDLRPLSPEDDDQQRDACRSCREFVKLGGAATKAEVIVRATVDAAVPGGWSAEFNPFAQSPRYYLYDTDRAPREAAAACAPMWLHGTPAFWKGRGGHVIWPAGLSRAANEKTQTVDFDELAEVSVGIKRLGILRMDVDSLGVIFQRGLGERASIVQLAGLSRQLTYFFGGYVATLLKHQDYASRAQIIYSGGDDLFIVGAWSTIPLLGKKIRDDFRRFAGDNPAVSISGGIEITLPRLPITVAAELAADAEAAAKDLRGRKDSITFLGEPLGWEEFDALLSLKDRLEGLFDNQENGNLARATLRILHAIAIAAREADCVIRESGNAGNADDLTWAVKRGKWAWQAAYAIARGPQNAELQSLYKDLNNIGPSVRGLALALLKPTTEWIDLLRRERNNER